MNHTKISVIVLFVFGLVACQSTEKLVTEKLASYGPPFDAEWHKKALQSKRELKKKAYNRWLSYEDIVHDANRDIMISELGIKKWSYGMHSLQCTPIDSYNIFYDDLMNWTPDQPIEKIMKLDTSIYKTLISSNKIFFRANYHDLNKRPFLGQTICRLGSDYLSDAYFVKKLPIFSISVFKNLAWAHSPLSSDILYVYIEEGVYKCYKGTKYFLLSDYIATLKSRSVKNNGYTR